MHKDLLICTVPALFFTLALYALSTKVAVSSAASPGPSASQTTSQNFYADLQNIRGQLDQYQFEHNNALPRFASHGWVQLITRTDANGHPASAPGSAGPYLRNAPINPFNRSSEILVVQKLSPNQKAPARYGFLFDQSTGRLYGLNADGTLFDELAANH
jgi:hypothetical protein